MAAQTRSNSGDLGFSHRAALLAGGDVDDGGGVSGVNGGDVPVVLGCGKYGSVVQRDETKTMAR